MPDRGEPLCLAVVCEARADFDLAATLVDRVLCDSIPWLAQHGSAEPVRTFWQAPSGQPFLRWREVPGLARERGVRAHGHFDGKPGAADAHAARLALLLLAQERQQPSAVVLLRDTDGDLARCQGMQQARIDPQRVWPFPIVLGAAHTKRECWLLAGFEPETPDERQALQTVKAELGFDPCLAAEGLTAVDEGAKRSAKRVLSLLSGGEPERERRCYAESPLSNLHQRSSANGLRNFLAYLEKRLRPLF